jgi:hypothetical protein
VDEGPDDVSPSVLGSSLWSYRASL